jgi:signal transduction histidine kinase/ABC-type multidrug transport system ATPase subunit
MYLRGPDEVGAEPLLAVRGLSRRLGGTMVLEDVDLRIGQGELVALVGENGAGKSTLIRVLARALSADSGEIRLGGRPLPLTPAGVQNEGLAVVWQDLALCDNLDAVANLFLGRERRSLFLSEAEMYQASHALFRQLGVFLPDLDRPVGSLSGGQRQAIAIARAVLGQPRVLLLDEPTAALGVKESRIVDDLLRRLRRSGLGLLLVSHRMEQVFDLADRILVLRHGHVVADVTPVESHPDDIIAMMSGVETDSSARKQLHRLHSLMDQLSDVEPSASLPLIVSAIATALDQPQVCVHLVQDGDGSGPPMLVRAAAVGLRDPLLAVTARVPLDDSGGPIGQAAARHRSVVVDDMGTLDGSTGLAATARLAGMVAAWAVPIVGSDGLLGVVSGWSSTHGRLHADQLEMISLYAGQAAAAIERDRLTAEVSRRNRTLETLRGVLESLAGPEHVHGGLDIALRALGHGLGADALAMYVERGDAAAGPSGTTPHDERPGGHDIGRAAAAMAIDPASGAHRRLECTAVIDFAPMAQTGGRLASAAMASAADAVLVGPALLDRARLVGADVVAVPLMLPAGVGVLAAWWGDSDRIVSDTFDLLDDASRSIGLAIERDMLDEVNQEAEALRRSHRHQRAFLSRLSHELRTPLTAIHGYASSLNQTDVAWGVEAQHRFLDLIVTESDRMGRLVADLLDSSALDSGTLRLQSDWCDLGLVIEAAIACVPTARKVSVNVDPGVGPVWGDHDRLEQVFVNLLENAARHGDSEGGVDVVVEADGNTVHVRVIDRGPGIPAELAEAVFQPSIRGDTVAAGEGLGLAIARGIVEAHHGEIVVEPAELGATLRVTLPVEPSLEDVDA